MKQILTLLLFTIGISAQATVRVITCQNGANHFLPVTVNAIVGDTIHWTWVSGNHIVGPILETDIPALADTWYAPIDNIYNTFDYVVAYPGTYYYVCHPLAPHGEDGFINVTLTTAVPEVLPVNSTGLYPNPFTEQLTLETSGATQLDFHTLTGELVRSIAVASGPALLRTDLGTLPSGIYFVSILREGVVVETKRMVKQ